MSFSCYAILSAYLSLILASAAPNRTSIYFSYIAALTGPGLRTGGGIPVVDLALEQINNRTDILPNYTLSYTTIHDSKCDVTASLNAFNEDFVDVNESDHTFLTLVCCGCSTAAIPVAEISHYWNVPHVAFDAGAAILNDRKRFRNFYRTVPQYEFLPRALFLVALEFGWTQMAVITQTENLFISITNELADLFQQRGWSLDTTINIKSNSNPFSHETAFQNLNGDYRIIFINAYPNFAFALLCQAYHRNMLAPKYVWITPSWYQENWWKSSVNASCAPEIMKQALNGSLAIVPRGFFPLGNDSAFTTSRISPSKYKNEYDRRLNDTSRYPNLTKVDGAGMAFDAIWAVGLALHNASESVRMNDSSGCEDHPGELVPLEKFDYRNKMMGCVIRRSIANTNFAGITGNIAFNENGSRVDNNDIILHQYRLEGNGDLIKSTVINLAIFTNSSSFAFTEGESANTLWAGGVPYDGSAEDAVHRNHIAMEVIYSILATAGLVFTAVCFVFNLLFRNTKIVKLSSPNLNYLIIIGAGCLYASVYMFVFTANKDNSLGQTVLCNLRQWSSTFGYTICFAVILAKTWRIYLIFTNPHQKKKILKDWMLLLIVMVVVLVDLLIIAIGTAIPSSRLNATLVRDTQHPTFVTAEQTNIDNFIYTCISPKTIIWLAISYAYKGLLQLVAMFMAFHIRRVKIKALNDSKEIAIIVYINSIILALLAVVEFALNTYHEVYAALFGLGLMVGATLFLSLVFIPKMIDLAKDPKGQSVFDDSNSTEKKSSTVPMRTTETDPSTTISHYEELTTLRNRVIELEEKLAATMNT